MKLRKATIFFILVNLLFCSCNSKQNDIEKEKEDIFSKNSKNSKSIENILENYKVSANELFSPNAIYLFPGITEKKVIENLKAAEGGLNIEGSGPFSKLSQRFLLIKFPYELTPELKTLATEEKDMPFYFRESILKKIPIYLLVKWWDVSWGKGNKFQDAGLSRADIGKGYSMAGYGGDGKCYSLNFMYLDKKEKNNEQTKYSHSCANTDNPYFGFIEIGRTLLQTSGFLEDGRSGSLKDTTFHHLNKESSFHINGKCAPIDSNEDYIDFDNNNIVHYIFNHFVSYDNIESLIKNYTYSVNGNTIVPNKKINP